LFSENQVQEYFDFGQALKNLGAVVLPLALALAKETEA
jgi:chloramphenicol O-acetyltransferase